LAKALGHSIGAIAQAIGRPKSTISRELSLGSRIQGQLPDPSVSNRVVGYNFAEDGRFFEPHAGVQTDSGHCDADQERNSPAPGEEIPLVHTGRGVLVVMMVAITEKIEAESDRDNACVVVIIHARP
jgi:hypothetical protein